MSKKRKKVAGNPGYRQFMSNFSTYARENGIHIHGGRGSFAKKAGEVWRDLKGKPAWKENIDVILPQYLQGVEGAPPKESNKDRLNKILLTVGADQFQWWEIKSLYGLWTENPHVIPEKDRLFVLDVDQNLIEISTDENSFSLYKLFKDEVDRGTMDEYSFVSFEASEMNDLGGIDILFNVEESTKYTKKIHDKTAFEWSQKVRDMYAREKEAIGEKGAAKIAKARVNVKSAAKEETQKAMSKSEMARVRQVSKKLEALNKAVSDLEKMYNNGMITRTEYRNRLKILYKL